MAFLGVDWGSADWGVVVPILISIAALAVSIWTKWSESRQRREAETARRSADLVATLGGSNWEPEDPNVGLENLGTTTYVVRLHNAGQMSAGDITIWAELSSERCSEEIGFADLAPDARGVGALPTAHVYQTPLELCARWTDGNGTHVRALLLLDPYS